jgi:hypothetical protein
MKKIIFLLIATTLSFFLKAQDFSGSQFSIINFARRVYNIEKFEGVRLIELDNTNYAIIAVKLPKKSSQDINTLAQAKAKVYLSQFQNGSHLSSELIIFNTIGDSINKKQLSQEIFKEYSSGFVKGLISISVTNNELDDFITHLYYAKLNN